MLAERHLRTRPHRHRIVVDVRHGIPRPPFGLQLYAPEVVQSQVGLHKVSLLVVVEGVEFIDHQFLHIRGVALLGLAVVVDKLQVVVTFYDTALVEHHGAQRCRAVAVSVEGVGLRLLLAFALWPYLYLELVLTDGRHDIDVVLCRKYLRGVLRGVNGALDYFHADVEGTVALPLVQTQHYVLVVTSLVYLVVKPHRILRRGIVEQRFQRFHLLAVVLNDVVYLLPLKLAHVSPRIQRAEVYSPLHSEIVSPCLYSAGKQHHQYGQ